MAAKGRFVPSDVKTCLKRAREAAQHLQTLVCELRLYDEKATSIRGAKVDLLVEAGERAFLTKTDYVDCCERNEYEILSGRGRIRKRERYISIERSMSVCNSEWRRR